MKSFFSPKTARVEGLATLSPMDERFLALRLSEEQVFPPTEEAAEAAELQRAALAFYTAAKTAEGYAEAQRLSDVAVRKKLAVEATMTAFNEVVWCLSAAVAAEKMEVSAKAPNYVAAGEWKMLIAHATKRLSEHEQRVEAAAAVAAAAAAAARKAAKARKSDSITPVRHPTLPNRLNTP
jgi:hypothetical protein